MPHKCKHKSAFIYKQNDVCSKKCPKKKKVMIGNDGHYTCDKCVTYLGYPISLFYKELVSITSPSKSVETRLGYQSFFESEVASRA